MLLGVLPSQWHLNFAKIFKIDDFRAIFMIFKKNEAQKIPDRTNYPLCRQSMAFMRQCAQRSKTNMFNKLPKELFLVCGCYILGKITRKSSFHLENFQKFWPCSRCANPKIFSSPKNFRTLAGVFFVFFKKNPKKTCFFCFLFFLFFFDCRL